MLLTPNQVGKTGDILGLLMVVPLLPGRPDFLPVYMAPGELERRKQKRGRGRIREWNGKEEGR